jgi:hypothetical protein
VLVAKAGVVVAKVEVAVADAEAGDYEESG